MIAWVLLAGFLSGMLASLVGVGGAVITTPMIRFLGATPIEAVGSTVPAILPGAISGVLRYHREGYVRTDIAALAGTSGIVFAVLGGWVADVVDARWLMVATALLVLWSSASLIRDGRTTSTDEPTEVQPRRVLIVGLGMVAGFLAGLLGVGGGIIMTPGLTLLARLPVKHAIATSLAAVAMMSVASLATHIALDHIDWQFAIPLAVAIVPGARVGAHLTVIASDRTVRLVCGALLALIAVVSLGFELAEFR